MAGVMKIPVGSELICEYRGLGGQPGEFADRETGEMIAYSEKHRFEYEDASGVIGHLELRSSKIDQVAAFNVDDLNKGDYVRIEGVVTVRDDGGYFTPQKVERCKADGKPLVAAA